MYLYNYLNRPNNAQPSQQLFRARTKTSFAVLALTAGLFLSGCGNGDADSTADSTNSPISAPTPVPAAATEADPAPSPTEYIPASSAGPARNVPVPQVPWEISYNNEKGAKAFVQYWFDVLRYVELTGNPEPLKEISDPNCAYCNFATESVPEVYESGFWIERGEYTISNTSMETDQRSGTVTVFHSITQAPTFFHPIDGELNEDNSLPEETTKQALSQLHFSEDAGQWIMLRTIGDGTIEN